MLGRPSLPTSTSDFALPASTVSSCTSTVYASDDLSPFMLRFRRPSLLSPHSLPNLTDRPLRSPLGTTVIAPRSSTNTSGEESESDRETSKMWTDSPPSSGDSGAATPLLPGPLIGGAQRDQDSAMKTGSRSPSTPPLPSTSQVIPDSDTQALEPSTVARAHARRLSHTLKVPRILSLISESKPDETELQSEAQFQRLVASSSALPSQPRTPRAPSDRGRYPEEAGEEEFHREDTPSDDGELDDSVPYSTVEPITIMKPVTPAQSVNGDDLGMLESPGGVAMDVDVPSSSFGSPGISSWRYTPPPTSSVVRSNKRKADDRFDPYPTVTKRRAVSPSLSYLRESQPSLFNPRTPSGTPRLHMPTPMPIPIGPYSATSSPTVGSAPSCFARGSASALSSPTMRAQISLGSPVLRPILPRPRRHGEDRREVDGAGDGVSALTLG